MFDDFIYYNKVMNSLQDVIRLEANEEFTQFLDRLYNQITLNKLIHGINYININFSNISLTGREYIELFDLCNRNEILVKDLINYHVNDQKTVTLEGPLRAGVHIRLPGSVVVLGTIHSGACLIAGGNIFVVGVVRGMLISTSAEARIVAAAFENAHVQIAFEKIIINEDKECRALIRDGKLTWEVCNV